MTIHTENNKKTEAIKEFLSEFIKEFELERQVTLHDKKVLEKQKNPKQTRIGLKVVHLEAIKLGIKTLNSIQFESVDNVNSIKNLKKAELFFSAPYYVNHFKFLEDFKFSYCLSQITPNFLTYADIEIQLDAFDKKAIDLLHRGYKSAGTEASWVVISLRNLNQWYFQEEKINYYDYKLRALEIIHEARPLLEQHYDYKELLANLVLLILIIGIPLFIANKAVNGHFLFFQKPNCSEPLDKLNQTVSQLSL